MATYQQLTKLIGSQPVVIAPEYVLWTLWVGPCEPALGLMGLRRPLAVYNGVMRASRELPERATSPFCELHTQRGEFVRLGMAVAG